jgi:hypothetical protein
MSLPAEAAYTLDCTDPWEPLGAPHEGIPAKAWDGPSRLLRVFTCGAPSGSRALTGRLRPVFGQKIGRNLGDSQLPGRRGRDVFQLCACYSSWPASDSCVSASGTTMTTINDTRKHDYVPGNGSLSRLFNPKIVSFLLGIHSSTAVLVYRPCSSVSSPLHPARR